MKAGKRENVKRILMVLIVAAMVAGTMSAFAEGTSAVSKCCGMTKEGAKTNACPVMAKLNLTPEQKAKFDEIKAKCMKAGCTPESCAQMMKDLQAVLTPEQMTQFKACCSTNMGGCCAKSGKMECPMAK